MGAAHRCDHWQQSALNFPFGIQGLPVCKVWCGDEKRCPPILCGDTSPLKVVALPPPAAPLSLPVYAIKHVPTGEYMPARMNKGGTGASYWSPGPKNGDEPYDPNPRIFYTMQSARNALTMWLQGCWVREQGIHHYFDGPESYDHMLVNEPPVPRRREHMEIVTLRLEGL